MKHLIFTLLALLCADVALASKARRYPVFRQAYVYYNFEQWTHSPGPCDDVRGTIDLTLFNTFVAETVSPIAGGQSFGGDGTFGCGIHPWAAAPWNSTTQSWTFGARFTVDSVASFQWIVRSAGGTNFSVLINGTTGDLEARGGGTSTVISTTPELDGEISLCFVHDNSTSPDTWEVYLNGGSTPDFSWTGDHTAQDQFGLGMDANSTGVQFLDGLLDEAYVWNLALDGAGCDQWFTEAH